MYIPVIWCWALVLQSLVRIYTYSSLVELQKVLFFSLATFPAALPLFLRFFHPPPSPRISSRFSWLVSRYILCRSTRRFFRSYTLTTLILSMDPPRAFVFLFSSQQRVLIHLYFRISIFSNFFFFVQNTCQFLMRFDFWLADSQTKNKRKANCDTGEYYVFRFNSIAQWKSKDILGSWCVLV